MEADELARGVVKLGTMNGKKSRRFFVRFENPETRFLEPTNPEIDDYAPEELPGRRPVLGYKPDGKLTTLREGKNQMVCLISDPAKPTFESACYHKISNPIWRGAAN